jgi:hypothetical protein
VFSLHPAFFTLSFSHTELPLHILLFCARTASPWAPARRETPLYLDNSLPDLVAFAQLFLGMILFCNGTLSTALHMDISPGGANELDLVDRQKAVFAIGFVLYSVRITVDYLPFRNILAVIFQSWSIQEN